MDRVIALRQISVTALFYLDNSRKPHLWSMRTCRPKDAKRRAPQRAGGGGPGEHRERAREHMPPGTVGEKALWLLLLCVFSPCWACPMQIGLSQECCLFYLRSSLRSSDLHLTFLCSIFMGFSLPCLLSEVSEVAQSCPTLCEPMDCSLPGSSVHGIFQAVVLDWVAIPFSRGSSQPRDRTQVSHIVDRRFTVWATRGVLVF